MCLYVLSSVLWCPLRYPHTHNVRFVFTSSCLYEGSCLIYVICVCVKWCATHIVLCFCLVCLRLVYQMLPVSLDCPFLITLRCSLTFIYLVYQMLPVSLDYPFLITLRYSLTFIYSFSGLSISDYPSVFSNVYHVASFSRLSISDYPSVFSNVYVFHVQWFMHPFVLQNVHQ